MAATWTVTGDLPNQFSTTGSATPVLGHTISFITGNGHQGTIFVSDDQYTTAIVKAALQTKANLVDAINALTHEA